MFSFLLILFMFISVFTLLSIIFLKNLYKQITIISSFLLILISLALCIDIFYQYSKTHSQNQSHTNFYLLYLKNTNTGQTK